ncbi:MAG: DUF4194 domain-containing protein [Verrucomicrobia bacterium]|jgi:hypothetical protein|nr:DUF4194 domain-containing protein [Verrucomicrobiota bacterium]|tara:strand:+ start:4099 stop:4740 length:642 start_codon:yes stop_codon:yes gene_type:complete
MILEPEPTESPGLISLPEGERARLGEALQELLASGSITGLENSKSALYHWCRQYFEWVKEAAALAGLEVLLVHEERLIQAIPSTGALRLKLPKDATLVWLALWYAGDVRWRDEGMDQAFLSVSELNGLIQDQLIPDAVGAYPRGTMEKILRQAARFNLIRFEAAEHFEDSGIEVLPAIRRVVPFRELAEWTEAASAFSGDEETTLNPAEEETE